MNEPLRLRIERVWRQGGLLGVSRKCLAVLAEKLCGYTRHVRMRRSLGDPLPVFVPSLPLSFDWLKPEGLAEYLDLRGVADTDVMYGADAVRDLLKVEDRCLIARHAGRIVAATWISVASVRAEGILPIEDGEVYLFGDYTALALRGQGIMPALRVELLRRLREEGHRSAMLLTRPDNTAALRANAKTGFRVDALTHGLKWGSWHRFWVVPAVRRA
jgi:GNAT superfamily N-acetyltransferase